MSVVPQANGDRLVPGGTALDGELAGLRDQIARLRSENARLLRLLELTPAQARPPGSGELLQDGGGLGGGDFAAQVDVLGDGWLGVSELVGDGAGG
jgi:hypothetical protein